MEHDYNIFVAKNAAGVRGIEYPGEFKIENYAQFTLNDSEYMLVFDLFGRFNKAFAIIIDMYECESITAEQVLQAEEITRGFMRYAHEPKRSAAQKVLNAVLLAKQLHMPLEFDF